MAQDSLTLADKSVGLRAVRVEDLPILFAQQLDPEANYMAAFTSKDPTDREAFMSHWEKIMADESITIRAVTHGEQLLGSILSHGFFGKPEMSYWFGKEFWGKGYATAALAHFLQILTTRPLYARVVNDNIPSLRVLQKNGFEIISEEKGFANARGYEVQEYVLKLDALTA